MRSLARNQQKIYYARIVLGDPVKDAYGNETGEKHKKYDSINEIWINVSPAKGNKYQYPFGADLQYNKVLSTSDTTIFTEDDINIAFWINKEPPKTIVRDSFSHNYELSGVANSLNQSLIAVKRVNGS